MSRRLPSALALAPIVVALGMGCFADDGDQDDRADLSTSFPEPPAPLPTRFAPDDLLTDDLVRGGEQISIAQVQEFLTEQGSALAHFTIDGRSAAAVIVDRSLDHCVSPLYMLARIQTESSLITSGTLRGIARATGCGCPDGARCDASLAGFEAQVDCAGALIEQYFAELDTNGRTRSNWKVGVAKTTLDGCRVKPANRATAALYSYNPWVGRYGKGCGSNGGATLLTRIFHDYWAAYHWGVEPTPRPLTDWPQPD